MAAVCRVMSLKSSPAFALMSRSSENPNIPISQITVTTRRYSKISTNHFNYITTKVIQRPKLVLISPVPPNHNVAVCCYHRYIFHSSDGINSKYKSEPKKEDLDETQTKLYDTFAAGIKLCSQGSNHLPGQGLFCLQLSGCVEHEKFKFHMIERGEPLPKFCIEAYKVHKAEAATQLLYNLRGMWFHGCSILVDDLSDLRKKVRFYDSKCREKAAGNLRTVDGLEVTLFAVADKRCVIDHKFISCLKELREFLSQLPEKRLREVYMTCSEVLLEERCEQVYTHISL